MASATGAVECGYEEMGNGTDVPGVYRLAKVGSFSTGIETAS